jgi:hypothetical protein
MFACRTTPEPTLVSRRRYAPALNLVADGLLIERYVASGADAYANICLL